MPTLVELEAVFVGEYKPKDKDGRNESHRQLPSVDGAQGIMFICPKCGNHSILVWFKNPRNAPTVPADALPKPGRWTFTGETVETVTLVPSVDLSKIDAENPASPLRCYWHGHVTGGTAQ